jgi:hypothetical protein
MIGQTTGVCVSRRNGVRDPKRGIPSCRVGSVVLRRARVPSSLTPWSRKTGPSQTDEVWYTHVLQGGRILPATGYHRDDKARGSVGTQPAGCHAAGCASCRRGRVFHRGLCRNAGSQNLPDWGASCATGRANGGGTGQLETKTGGGRREGTARWRSKVACPPLAASQCASEVQKGWMAPCQAG